MLGDIVSSGRAYSHPNNKLSPDGEKDRLLDVGEIKFDSNTTFVRLVYSTIS